MFPVIHGKRRFTCLASGLVRMEFSPSGVFEDRRSMVAYAAQRPIPFTSVTTVGAELHLSTELLTIISRDGEQAFFPANLEVRWIDHDLQQCWRPGDVDYANLGGTLCCLDQFSREALLAGVHPADGQSPDAHAQAWVSWDIIEYDPAYYRATDAEARLKEVQGVGDQHTALRITPDSMLMRTRNRLRDTYRYSTGILSRSGYFLLNDSTSAVLDADDFPVERNTPGMQDWYFFGYGEEYAAVLRDFQLISGHAPLPSKHIFGLWFSRWPAFDAQEAQEIVARFAGDAMPLSVLVVDMEWHKPGWCHFDWDPSSYPEPEAFFSWCHEQNLLVTLNVHPQRLHADDSHYLPFLDATGKSAQVELFQEDGQAIDIIRTDLCRKREASHYFSLCADPIVGQGMDFWWVDGFSGTLNGTIGQLVNNKLFYENVDTLDKRGMLLSRYGGVGSHRYGVFFTGDTYSHWEVLAAECEFNIRAGHLGMAYISHDIGGFVTANAPLIDASLYVRWVQFGVFSPVFRLHSAPGSGSRQPWDYGNANLAIVQRWLQFRNSLLPYIYTMARRHYDTGMPIVRGLFLMHPNDPRAYRFDEFYFGDALLVAPVVTTRSSRNVYLPAGDWYDYTTGERLSGEHECEIPARLAEIPLYAKAGSIICRQPHTAPPITVHLQQLLLEIFPAAQAEGLLYEDDGQSQQYREEAVAWTRFTCHANAETLLVQGYPTNGKAFGDTRDITVVLAMATPPSQVLLNDIALPESAWIFTAASRRTTIILPTLAVDASFTLSIIR